MARSGNALAHRLKRMHSRSGLASGIDAQGQKRSAAVDCGWGRLIFAQTFDDPTELIRTLRREKAQRRDIVFYVHEPHVLLALAPQEVFLDPSHTYRLDLQTYRTSRRQPRAFSVRRLASEADAHAVNRIYASRGMVPVKPEFFWTNRDSRILTHFVAEDAASGEILGAVTGVDHVRAFNDPERGSSLWCLAVDPQARPPGVGEMLVRRLADHFSARGANHMDLSVLHDNEQAIALYDKLGFFRVPVFAVKRRNPINEKLFTQPLAEYDDLNPYARLIVDEARRRGVQVDITDAQAGFFRLSHGGRSVHCRESLSELTSGVAVSICDDKAVTRRIVAKAGLAVPDQMVAQDDAAALRAFLADHGRVVVKPARGEQGRGVAVGLESFEEAQKAIENARKLCDRVLIEACVEGEDMRLVVIDFQLVAAALRRPPCIIGDGRRTIRSLIASSSRRRAAATGGESRIPVDAETERCLLAVGLRLDSIPDEGREIVVRRTANLHTGGSIHDVTDQIHPDLAEAAIKAASAIDIPVVGIDFIVRSPNEPDYVFIEANERPGLANHEPQPTAQRFVDLLFPHSGQRAPGG